MGQLGPLKLDSHLPPESSSCQCPLTTPLDLLQRRMLSRWRQVRMDQRHLHTVLRLNTLPLPLQSACCLFQSEPYNEVVDRLEIEIETGRLVIRHDHSPHSDVGARQEILQLLLCYSPIWLRLGLEVSHVVCIIHKVMCAHTVFSLISRLCLVRPFRFFLSTACHRYLVHTFSPACWPMIT